MLNLAPAALILRTHDRKSRLCRNDVLTFYTFLSYGVRYEPARANRLNMRAAMANELTPGPRAEPFLLQRATLAGQAPETAGDQTHDRRSPTPLPDRRKARQGTVQGPPLPRGAAPRIKSRNDFC